MGLCWALVEQARHEHMSDEYMQPVYYYCALVALILSLPDEHESPTVVPSKLNKGGGGRADEHWPPKYVSCL